MIRMLENTFMAFHSHKNEKQLLRISLFTIEYGNDLIRKAF